MEFNKAQLKNLQTISKKFGGFNSKLFKNYVNNKYGEGSWDKVNISIIETGKNNPDKKISEKYTAKEKEYYSQNGKFRNTEDLMNNLTAKGYKNLQQEGDFISGIDSEGNRSKWNVTGGFANKSVLGKESIWGDYKPYNPTDQEIKD
ncbi:hypothetical protein EOM39_07835, partial [Candidatus Gracilibacteria bacterium]|nr:hypothetical protein [Candidatus Gracilibacteria bacterium]